MSQPRFSKKHKLSVNGKSTYGALEGFKELTDSLKPKA